MQEKRHFKRLNVTLPVTLRVNGRLVPATTLNVSCGGVCLSVENSEIAAQGADKVEVILDLNQQSRDVSLRGEVTRIEGEDQKVVGIKFTNLYTVGHQTLEQFINRNRN